MDTRNQPAESLGYYPSKAWNRASSVMPKFVSIPSDVYEEFAKELAKKIEKATDKIYVPNVIIIAEREEMTYRLEGSFLIYYTKEVYPEGVFEEVSDIVPTWCEIHAYQGEYNDEVMNDGIFDRVKKIII